MLQHAVAPVIRYFGSRKKIFNVHFRNTRGRRDDFMEVAPDEGDVDFLKPCWPTATSATRT